MEAWRYRDSGGELLVVDTEFRRPNEIQRGIFLCRSLTLTADGILWGPCDAQGSFVFTDTEGMPQKAGPREAAIFRAFFHQESTPGTWQRVSPAPPGP